ncbi:MAG TPA: hypothetical protein ENN80_13685 [Candidatus Hydrogenedentes bacterium]|nr:hypothetical protein [Candidatus Hydrogenedentota bacterium]
MNLNAIFDAAYEHAMRQGYPIERDVLRACIEAATQAWPPFAEQELGEIIPYITEKPELLPTEEDDIAPWIAKWRAFFAAQTDWSEQQDEEEDARPPLLCDFGL